jgi:hypothetical protein
MKKALLFLSLSILHYPPLLMSAPPEESANHGSTKTRETADLHVTRCLTLGDDYTPNGGSFIVEINKKSRKGTIRNIVGVTAFEGFQTSGIESLFSLCKKKGMENSKDYENSYEICGFEFNSYPLKKNSKSYVNVRTKFHDPNKKIQDFRKKMGIFDGLRDKFINNYSIEKLVKLEGDEVGHVFPAGDNGEVKMNERLRLSCESRSDNSTVVEGANH